MEINHSRGRFGRLIERVRAQVSLPVLGLFALLCFVGSVAAVWAWQKNGSNRQELISVEARKGTIEDLVTATGALQPRDYVDVGAQVSGQLNKIHVDVGQSVAEGDLLAEIDAEQSAAKVEASRAQLRSLDAQLEQRRLSLVKAERDHARHRNLLAEDASTLENLQNAETEIGSMRAQMAQLRAQIDQLRATTRVEEANLKYTKIYAPMSGTVVSIAAKKGQTLNANQSAPNLMRIADLSLMNVQTQVSEADVSRLRIGMDVYFTRLGGQGRRWYGKLKKIEPTPTVTNNVVLYNALFEVPNDSGALMTQMTAQVFFIVAQQQDVLLIPMSALQKTGSDKRRPNSMAQETTAERSTAADGGTKQPSPAAGDAPRPDFSGLSEAEREKRRAARRAAREQGVSLADSSADRRQSPRPAATGLQEEVRQRDALVKVIQPDGSVKERKITVGISNRIHVVVLSGLQEGEKIVVGLRENDKSRNEGQKHQSQSPMQQQQLPGIPGGTGKVR